MLILRWSGAAPYFLYRKFIGRQGTSLTAEFLYVADVVTQADQGIRIQIRESYFALQRQRMIFRSKQKQLVFPGMQRMENRFVIISRCDPDRDLLLFHGFCQPLLRDETNTNRQILILNDEIRQKIFAKNFQESGL